MTLGVNRVTGKRGFIRRSALDLNYSRAERVLVHQGIFGRIFSLGTVTTQRNQRASRSHEKRRSVPRKGRMEPPP